MSQTRPKDSAQGQNTAQNCHDDLTSAFDYYLQPGLPWLDFSLDKPQESWLEDVLHDNPLPDLSLEALATLALSPTSTTASGAAQLHPTPSTALLQSQPQSLSPLTLSGSRGNAWSGKDSAPVLPGFQELVGPTSPHGRVVRERGEDQTSEQQAISGATRQVSSATAANRHHSISPAGFFGQAAVAGSQHSLDHLQHVLQQLQHGPLPTQPPSQKMQQAEESPPSSIRAADEQPSAEHKQREALLRRIQQLMMLRQMQLEADAASPRGASPPQSSLGILGQPRQLPLKLPMLSCSDRAVHVWKAREQYPAQPQPQPQPQPTNGLVVVPASPKEAPGHTPLAGGNRRAASPFDPAYCEGPTPPAQVVPAGGLTAWQLLAVAARASRAASQKLEELHACAEPQAKRARIAEAKEGIRSGCDCNVQAVMEQVAALRKDVKQLQSVVLLIAGQGFVVPAQAPKTPVSI